MRLLKRCCIVIQIGSRFVWIAALAYSSFAFAADTAPTTNATDANVDPIELPEPNAEIAKLINRGNVKFTFYDPEILHRKFAGETQFEFRYSYKTHSRWKQIQRDGSPMLEIKVQYDQVSLQREHVISLPQEMIGSELFDQRLTLHEFDHVRISADERLPKLLESMLVERNGLIVHLLNPPDEPENAVARDRRLSRLSRRIVKDASDRVFDQFVEIVHIRYRELDRLSNYGLQPLSREDRNQVIDSQPAAAEIMTDELLDTTTSRGRDPAESD